MTKRMHESPRLLGFVPYQIEAEWDPRYAYLAGFPLNLLYAGLREIEGTPQPASCCYWVDPGTYAENPQRREMWYFPKHESPYSVCVSFDRDASRWQTIKYQRDRVVCVAEGTSFDQAMLQTTLIALLPDEPVDAETQPEEGD